MDARYRGTYEHVGQPDFDAYLLQQLDHSVAIMSARAVLLRAADAPRRTPRRRPLR